MWIIIIFIIMVWWRNLLSILFLYWLFMLVSKAACWCCCLFSLIIVPKTSWQTWVCISLGNTEVWGDVVRLLSKDEIEFPFGRFLCLLYLFSSSRILGVKQAHQCRPSPIASRCYAFYLFSMKLLSLEWVNHCFHFFFVIIK